MTLAVALIVAAVVGAFLIEVCSNIRMHGLMDRRVAELNFAKNTCRCQCRCNQAATNYREQAKFHRVISFTR